MASSSVELAPEMLHYNASCVCVPQWTAEDGETRRMGRVEAPSLVCKPLVPQGRRAEGGEREEQQQRQQQQQRAS